MTGAPPADSPALDVLIPSYRRPEALAVTLSGLAAQDERDFRVVVSDQSSPCVADHPLVAGMVRVLQHHGVAVEIDSHLPRRGVAENRAHLLSRAHAAYVLFLDDDVWLEPWGLRRLREAVEKLDCGFVGYAVQGLSFREDRRPDELEPYEEWSGRVVPERVRRGSPGWRRWMLHNAANPTHLGERLALRPGEWRAYKVAWIGACAMYRRELLEEVGGFSFWGSLEESLLEEHAGEDVVAQLRVMERYGAAGLLPSGAVHLELPTTIPRRSRECYDAVGL